MQVSASEQSGRIPLIRARAYGVRVRTNRQSMNIPCEVPENSGTVGKINRQNLPTDAQKVDGAEQRRPSGAGVGETNHYQNEWPMTTDVITDGSILSAEVAMDEPPIYTKMPAPGQGGRPLDDTDILPGSGLTLSAEVAIDVPPIYTKMPPPGQGGRPLDDTDILPGGGLNLSAEVAMDVPPIYTKMPPPGQGGRPLDDTDILPGGGSLPMSATGDVDELYVGLGPAGVWA